MKVLIVLTVLVSCALAGQISQSSCGSGSRPQYIDIAGCSSSGCSVVNGNKVRISGAATLPRKTVDPIIKLKYHWLFVSGEISLGAQKHVCKHINRPCPINQGETVQFSLDVPIKAPMPWITPTVTASVLHEDGSEMLCSEFKIYIASS